MGAERSGALIILLLGIGYLWEAFAMQVVSIGDPLGPKAFPIFLGALMSLLGISLLIKPEKGANARLFGKTSLGAIILAGILAVYGFGIEWIGYPIATVIFLLVATRILGERSWITGILLSVGLSIGVFALFTLVLDIRLPLGPIGEILK